MITEEASGGSRSGVDIGVDVGVDIGGTKMLMVARAAGGELVADARSRTGTDTVGQELEDDIARFCAGLGRPVDRLAIAVPGLIDAHATVRLCDVLPRLAGWRPAADLVINDIRAALASAVDTMGTDDSVLCVVAGTAVGAAFTDTAGAVFGGAAGWAGELGYMPLDAGPVPRRLDDAAGGAGLIADLGLPADEIHRRVEAGDAPVRARVEAAGEALGMGLATCINLLNPRVVVLGGGCCGFRGYREAAVNAAEVCSLPESWAGLRLGAFADDRFAADGALAALRAGSR